MGEAKHEANLHGNFYSSLLRALMVILVSGSFLLALAMNLRMLFRASSIVKGSQAPWSFIFPVDRPEFREHFLRGLLSFSWPWIPVTYIGIFIIVLGLVCWYWYIATKARADSVMFLLPALTPTFVGLGLAPLITIRMIEALPEQGLRNPAAAGATVGEATQAVCVGALLSLICILGVLRHRKRFQKHA